MQMLNFQKLPFFNVLLCSEEVTFGILGIWVNVRSPRVVEITSLNPNVRGPFNDRFLEV